MSKTISIRIERCMGCKTCELECALAHSEFENIRDAVAEGGKLKSRLNVEAYSGKAIPVHCRHCKEPACVYACPTGAASRDKETEIVDINNERCIGCKMCIQACPFGVITISPDGKGVLKCDLCIKKLEKGEKPACVTGCPTNALVFTEEEEANKSKRKKAAEQLVKAQGE